GGAIMAEAALSFIGLGAQPPQPSWGAMVAEGRDLLRVAPWVSIAPGVAIGLAVLGLNLLGDGLRDALDVRGLGGGRVAWPASCITPRTPVRCRKRQRRCARRSPRGPPTRFI